jgi:hypothetical protein
MRILTQQDHDRKLWKGPGGCPKCINAHKMCPCFKMSESYSFLHGSLANSKFISFWRNCLSCFVAFLQNFLLITRLSSVLHVPCWQARQYSITVHQSLSDSFVSTEFILSFIFELFRVRLFVFCFNLSVGRLPVHRVYIFLCQCSHQSNQQPIYCMFLFDYSPPTSLSIYLSTLVSQ